jgi:hypothetical protein
VVAAQAALGSSVAKFFVFGRFPMAREHQLLLLMQQILAFRASFVDLGRPFDILRSALFRWNSPCEIESAIILN